MVDISFIIGITIVIINLLPILFKKYKLLIITGAISMLLGLLLMAGVM